MWHSWSLAVHRYKLKDDVRESMYDACNEWTSMLRKSGCRFMGGDQPNLADLVSQYVCSRLNKDLHFEMF